MTFCDVKLNSFCVLHIDDSIIFGLTEEVIQKAHEDLKQIKLKVAVEGDISNFLDIHIDCLNNDLFHLHHSHQITKILKDLMPFDSRPLCARHQRS